MKEMVMREKEEILELPDFRQTTDRSETTYKT
jgi:hypothetical protein